MKNVESINHNSIANRNARAASGKAVGKSNEHEIVPDAARTIIALRHLGYDPTRAVGDLVDNSIEAGATLVDVRIARNESTSKRVAGNEKDRWDDHRRIEIVDNGRGVPEALRAEVFRLGARVTAGYDTGSWSVFGVGLKTASWSMGRRITMITKTQEDTAPVALVMDVDRVIDEGKWVVVIRDALLDEATFFATSAGEHGTIVTVDRLDQLDDQDMKQLASRLPNYLGRTYSKITRDAKDQSQGRVEIKVDGISVESHDPLHRSEADVTTLLPRTEVVVEDKNGKPITVWVSATHLPHPDLLEAKDPERRKRYRYSLTNQGIYVFREQRLIMSGETLGIFAKDFHYNSFRAEIEFGEDADELFAVKIDKAAIVLPQASIDRIGKALKPALAASNSMWRATRVSPASSETELHDTSSSLIAARERALPTIPVTTKSIKGIANGGKAISVQAKERRKGQKHAPVIDPVSDLPSDVLWEPFLEDARVRVRLNTSHPYYRAMYPALRDLAEKEPEAFRLMDQFVYALGRAELMSAGDESIAVLMEFRHFVSSALRIMLDR